MAEVQYAEMLKRLLGRIGEDNDINFSKYSSVKSEKGGYGSKEWTYETGDSFQVALCRWVGSRKICREAPSPTPIVTVEEESAFENVLREIVYLLKQEI
ncbi:MAG: hypothetical protein M3416_18385 [Acidobacteriota bacterium]|nr:hypothetical protein [Acidobacteriota bacterium]